MTVTTDLADFLADRDEPCPSCGYNLRGLTQAACPECGASLTLRVNLAEPRLASFIGGVIALSIGAGFHTLVYGYFLVVLLGDFGASHADPEVWTLMVGAVGSSVGLCLWVRYWRRLRDRPPSQRWTLVVVSGVWSLGTAILFFSLAR
jgi:hypothetical protein